MGSKAKWYLALASVAVAWCGLAAVLLRPSFQIQDLALYYRASRASILGMVAYRDFAFEYPPMALIPMIAPRLFWPAESLQFATYVRFFVAMNAVWLVLLARCVDRIARKSFPWRDPRLTVAIYVGFAIIAAPVLPWRFDLFPALLTAAAVLAIHENRPGWAGALIGLAGATKLYPFALIPVCIAWYVAAGDRQGVARFIRAAVGVSAATLLPFVILAGPDFLSFVRYHALRGLEIESAAAGILMLLGRSGVSSLEVINSYGAMHLQSAGFLPVQSWLPVVAVGSNLAVSWAGYRRFRAAARNGEPREKLLTDYVLATVLLFVLTNKVFSPQYLAWLLPWAPLLTRGRLASAAAIFILTIAIFPYGFHQLVEMRVMPIVLLNARNGAAAALALLLMTRAGPARPSSVFSGRSDHA